MRTLKQVATNMADAFTRFGLWKGGGSGGNSSITYDLENLIETLPPNKIQEYTAIDDCYVFTSILSNNGVSLIYINNVIVATLYNDKGTVVISYPPIFLEKGNTIKVERHGTESWMWHELKVYGVKNIENSLHEYSTEEKVVGKWIDGKDIYEKVIQVDNFIVGNNEIPLENLDTIINYSGDLIFTDYPYYKRVFPYIQNNSQSKVAINHYTNTKFVVVSAFKCNTINIIIQYTKTE